MRAGNNLSLVGSIAGAAVLFLIGLGLLLLDSGETVTAAATFLAQSITAGGVVVAICALLYQVWKDGKFEEQKFAKVHKYVDAYCDELNATLSPFTKNRSELVSATQLLALPPIDVAFAERTIFDQYEYFVYPTDMNFRSLVQSVRSLVHEHERMQEVTKVKIAGDETRGNQVIEQINAVLMQLVEAIIVSATITRLLDVSVQFDHQRGHMMPASNLKVIQSVTGVEEVRIREIARELRCKFDESS